MSQVAHMEQEGLFRLFIEQIRDIIVLQDLSHNFLLSNEYTAKLFGYKDKDTMLGIAPNQMQCPAVECADLFVEQSNAVLKKERELTLLDVHPYADGQTHVLLTKKSPAYTSDGVLMGSICHCREITNNNMMKLGMVIAQSDQHFSGKMSKGGVSYQFGEHGDDDLFSKREKECLFYLMRGKTVKETADILFISSRTAENHVANMKQKLGINTKSQLIEYGIGAGYLNFIPKKIIESNFSSLI